MSETIFEKRVLDKLEHMERRINVILDYIEDRKLSDEDKEALREALKEEKEGKLLSKKQVFN